jgi:hypothetical protein
MIATHLLGGTEKSTKNPTIFFGVLVEAGVL